MGTRFKNKFTEMFAEHILRSHRLDCKFQFPIPAGVNAIEVTIKLARKLIERAGITAFTNAFH